MKDATHCKGCREDFYNGQGADKCWLRDDAKLVTRYRLGWWTSPVTPGAVTKVRVPNCYNQTGTYAYFEKRPKHAVDVREEAARG